jgi:hypothetical protein
MKQQIEMYLAEIRELYRKAANLHGADRQRVLGQINYRVRRVGELQPPGTLWTPPLDGIYTPKPGKLGVRRK